MSMKDFGRKAFAVAAEPLPEIKIVQIHPAMAGARDYGDEVPPSIASLEKWLTEAAETLQHLNQVRTQGDPALTESAHVLKCAELGEKALQRIAKGYDRTRGTLNEASRTIEATIHEKSRLSPGPHAAEIRAVIRSLPEKERHAAVLKAMEQNDTATLAAVMDAPGITSGLSDEHRNNLREMWCKRVAPHEVKHREIVRKAQQRLMGAYDALLAQQDAVTLAERAKALRVRQNAAAASANALKTFEV